MIDEKILIQNSDKLEELIRRKDSGVMFGVAGSGNILDKKSWYSGQSMDQIGRARYQFSPEKGIMEVGGQVMPADVDCSLTTNTTDEKWYDSSGEKLPLFQKKVLERVTEESILRIVKQNVRGGNPDTNRDYPWDLAQYLSDDRSGNSYSIGIKAKQKHSYKKGEIEFLDQVFDLKDEDFIQLMDKIAYTFIPRYHQAIKGWAEYFKI